MRKLQYSLLGAVTGLSLMTTPSAAEQIGIINKELVCKRPKVTEHQLKIHSCATYEYPLAPLATEQQPTPPEPIPPYSS